MMTNKWTMQDRNNANYVFKQKENGLFYSTKIRGGIPGDCFGNEVELLRMMIDNNLENVLVIYKDDTYNWFAKKM